MTKAQARDVNSQEIEGKEGKGTGQAHEYFGLELPLLGGRNLCHHCPQPLKIRHCPLFRGVRASGTLLGELTVLSPTL